ncbi:MAG: hypothetical protein KAU29_09610, partial [Gammaproteobacteria bacterium]|nr:hypothetical protein [Gammaproteobacteria bacterium]
DVREKARRDAEAIERAKLEAELKKAAQALATAEAKGQQEAQARIKAEAAVKKAIQAKTAAEAKAKAAALKAKKDQAIAQAKARAKAEASAKAAAKKKVAVVIQAPAKPKPVNNRNHELQVLISTLEKTYAAGDLDGFSSVFATSARTGDQTDLTGIRSDYKSLFENTSSRKLTLSNLDWKLDNNYARGVGAYEVVSRSKGASQGIKSKGKVTLQLEGGSGKQLLITRFYFSESQSTKVDAPRARASVGELNQTLENFSSAYKEGNIEQFMVLFSPDASTNDRSTLQGIRGDYVDLFSGTESRRLDYSSMQWQWKGDIANGIGTYVVTVRSNGNDNNDIYRGKLRFSVKQYGDKLLISKFVFE